MADVYEAKLLIEPRGRHSSYEFTVVSSNPTHGLLYFFSLLCLSDQRCVLKAGPLRGCNTSYIFLGKANAELCIFG